MFYQYEHFGKNEYFCKETGRDFSIGFQTPFFSLLVGYVTMLPDGKVIFEMDYKIVVVDPVHNRMAVLAHGRHPVVEIEETSIK